MQGESRHFMTEARKEFTQELQHISEMSDTPEI